MNRDWTRDRITYQVGLRILPDAENQLRESAYAYRMNVSEFAGRLIEDGLARLGRQQQPAGEERETIYKGLETWLGRLLNEVHEAKAKGLLPWQEDAQRS